MVSGRRKKVNQKRVTLLWDLMSDLNIYREYPQHFRSESFCSFALACPSCSCLSLSVARNVIQVLYRSGTIPDSRSIRLVNKILVAILVLYNIVWR